MVKQGELYFDIHAEDRGGSLYRMRNPEGEVFFLYSHSTYDAEKDRLSVFETRYEQFADFWNMISENKAWHYLHPLFIHPEQRAFVKTALQKMNWDIFPDKKWQESHQRQWKKVLEDLGAYYSPK